MPKRMVRPARRRPRPRPRRHAAALSAAAFLAAAAAGAHAQTTPAGCVVDGASGQGATHQGAPLAAGDRIAAAGVVETTAAGRATLTCAGDVTVILGPSTRLDLAQAAATAPGAGNAAMRLLRGAAGFVARIAGGRAFRVGAPSAVAAVRSTEWAMIAERDGATAVFVREGAVEVRGSAGGRAALLRAADGVDVDAAGVVGRPERWRPERRAALDALLGPDWR